MKLKTKPLKHVAPLQCLMGLLIVCDYMTASFLYIHVAGFFLISWTRLQECLYVCLVSFIAAAVKHKLSVYVVSQFGELLSHPSDPYSHIYNNTDNTINSQLDFFFFFYNRLISLWEFIQLFVTFFLLSRSHQHCCFCFCIHVLSPTGQTQHFFSYFP